jgi:hypothetical protein
MYCVFDHGGIKRGCLVETNQSSDAGHKTVDMRRKCGPAKTFSYKYLVCPELTDSLAWSHVAGNNPPARSMRSMHWNLFSVIE